MSPLVSVVIPVFNRHRYVREAIESVLAQTYPAVEVVVTDDGSTDETPDVLRSFGDRIRVITQPNAGIAAARNVAVGAARGSLIALLDSDDRWLPNKLER